MSQSWLASEYDTCLFDLDGVIYIGPNAVPGVADALVELKRAGGRVAYVTNNASRTPETVANHLNELGMAATVENVVTSAQAGAQMLARALPLSSAVLVVGTEALIREVSYAGMRPVTSADDSPAAVIQGYHPNLNWGLIEQACFAIHAGSKYFATNLDETRPTERGTVPGAGPMVAAVTAATGVTPEVAGKPFPPLLGEAVRRTAATRAIFVGDRLDTDILGANRAQMDSLFVFSGTHGKLDLLAADADLRPTYIGASAADLILPGRQASGGDTEVHCGQQVARLEDGEIQLLTEAAGLQAQLDACWAVLRLAWRLRDLGETVIAQPALLGLSLVA